MGQLVEGLRAYLARTSEEQVAADWAKIEELNGGGPEVEEYIEQARKWNNIEKQMYCSESECNNYAG